MKRAEDYISANGVEDFVNGRNGDFADDDDIVKAFEVDSDGKTAIILGTMTMVLDRGYRKCYMRPMARLKSITALIWIARAGLVRHGVELIGSVSGVTLISKGTVV